MLIHLDIPRNRVNGLLTKQASSLYHSFSFYYPCKKKGTCYKIKVLRTFFSLFLICLFTLLCSFLSWNSSSMNDKTCLSYSLLYCQCPGQYLTPMLSSVIYSRHVIMILLTMILCKYWCRTRKYTVLMLEKQRNSPSLHISAIIKIF